MYRMPWYIKLNFLLLALFVVAVIGYQMRTQGLPSGVAHFLGFSYSQEVHRAGREARILAPPTAHDNDKATNKAEGFVDKNPSNP